MKKLAILALSFFTMLGCSRLPDEMETAMELRSKLLQTQNYSFLAKVTADYGDRLHVFSLSCSGDSNGGITFTVSEPESISGISGKLTGEGGTLVFDDTVLSFDLMAEGQLSPVSVPWILINTLRSGYLISAGKEEGAIRISVNESYDEDPLRLDIWLDQKNLPKHADMIYDGRRILSIDVENFEIL